MKTSEEKTLFVEPTKLSDTHLHKDKLASEEKEDEDVQRVELRVDDREGSEVPGKEEGKMLLY